MTLVKTTFDEFIDEANEPKYKVYIIMSKYELFTDLFLGEFKKNIPSNSLTRSNISSLRNDLDKLHYKSIVMQKRGLVIELDNVNKQGKEYLFKYMSNPSDYGTLFLLVKGYKAKRELLKRKLVKNSDKIFCIDLNFPSRKFIKDFVLWYSNKYNKKFDCNNSLNLFLKRASNDYDSYIDNLTLLFENSKDIINKDLILSLVEDKSSYSERTLFETITLLNKKTIHIKSLSDLLNEMDRSPMSIVMSAERYFKYLYQAKYLRLKGLFMKSDYLEKRREIYSRQDFKFPKPSVVDLSNHNLNYFLEMSEKITLKEIIYIRNLIRASLKFGNSNYLNEEDLYSLILKIIDRRNNIYLN